MNEVFNLKCIIVSSALFLSLYTVYIINKNQYTKIAKPHDNISDCCMFNQTHLHRYDYKDNSISSLGSLPPCNTVLSADLKNMTSI